MYQAVFTKRFRKQILKFPKKEQIRILDNIEASLGNPRRLAIKLEDTFPPIYRIRAGEYRIFFEVNDISKTMEITDVKRRTTQTYK